MYSDQVAGRPRTPGPPPITKLRGGMNGRRSLHSHPGDHKAGLAGALGVGRSLRDKVRESTSRALLCGQAPHSHPLPPSSLQRRKKREECAGNVFQITRNFKRNALEELPPGAALELGAKKTQAADLIFLSAGADRVLSEARQGRKTLCRAQLCSPQLLLPSLI